MTKKLINEVIQMYGGGHRYIVREDISERGIITYVEKNNPDKMLTINQYWELDTPYIMVHLTDTKGVIIRKDRFDYTKRRLEYVYTEENGHYYETFRKVGETMAKATKEAKIKDLEKRLADMTGYYEQMSKRNAEMAERGEESFLNSPTYYQMQEQLDFYKRIADLNQMHIDSQKKWGYRQADKVQQVYEDNKRFMERAGGEYFIGITEDDTDRNYEKLREEIRELKGKLEGVNLNLVERDKIIADMMIQIADLRAENKALKKSDADIEEEPRLDSTEDKFVQIQRLSKNIITLKHKLSTLRADLKREMQRRYDNYSESDETSYIALLSTNKVMEHLLEESNATYDRLKEEILSLREQLKGATTTPSEQGSEELQQEIADLQAKLRWTEGQCKVYEDNMRQIMNAKNHFSKSYSESMVKINELENELTAIFSRNSNPDMVTMYHLLDDRYKKVLEQLRVARKTIKELQSNQPKEEIKKETTATATTGKVGRPKVTEEVRLEVVKMKSEGASYRKIAETLKISVGSVTNIIKKYEKSSN